MGSIALIVSLSITAYAETNIGVKGTVKDDLLMRYLVHVLVIFYCISSNATTINSDTKNSDAAILKNINDRMITGKGVKLISQEIEHHVPLPPEFIKKNPK
jgi:hypothetical protein